MVQIIYQVDAFADKVFEGNPAAVCILQKWPEDQWMQNIAMENNLAETAFLVADGDQYQIRWFTPELEVDLCGHATLASAFVLFEHEGFKGAKIHLHSHRSGPLSVEKSEDGMLVLDFPADQMEKVAPYQDLIQAIGKEPVESWKGKTDYMLIYNNQDEIEDISPNFLQLNNVRARGVIVTAPGRDVDFVSRFFAPQSGINEDPVTGSAHTSLSPYWARRLNKSLLTARQISHRGGNLICEYKAPRVRIGGRAVLYLKGEISV